MSDDPRSGVLVEGYEDLHQIGRGEVLDALAAQLDAALGHLATLALEQVGHRAQRGRLARAVAPEDGDDAAFGNLQRHALEHQDHVVVDDLDAVDVENDVFCAHKSLGAMDKR